MPRQRGDFALTTDVMIALSAVVVAAACVVPRRRTRVVDVVSFSVAGAVIGPRLIGLVVPGRQDLVYAVLPAVVGLLAPAMVAAARGDVDGRRWLVAVWAGALVAVLVAPQLWEELAVLAVVGATGMAACRRGLHPRQLVALSGTAVLSLVVVLVVLGAVVSMTAAGIVTTLVAVGVAARAPAPPRDPAPVTELLFHVGSAEGCLFAGAVLPLLAIVDHSVDLGAPVAGLVIAAGVWVARRPTVARPSDLRTSHL